MNKTVQIPKEWKIKDLVNVIQPLENGSRPKGGTKGITNGIPSLGGEHLNNNGGFNSGNLKFIPSDFFKTLKKGIIKKYDILMVKDGYTGRTSFVDEKFRYKEAAVSEHVYIIRVNQEIYPKYLYYFLRSHFAQSLIKTKTKGIIAGINQKFVNDFPIIFPENKETQKQIVQKLDDILGQLEEKKKQILELQQNIEYKKIISTSKNSILEQATLGKLTKNWRKIHSNILDGHTVLENIRKMNKKKISVTNSTILEIPNNWTTCFMGDVFEIQGGIQKTQKRKPSKNSYPYLRVGNVYKNRLDLSRIEHFEIFSDKELDRFRLKSGDILVVEGNGSKNEIGRSAIWHDEIQNCVHQNHIIRCRPLDGMSSDFVSYFMNSLIGRTMLMKIAITTSGLYTLSTGKLSSIMIPLPPIEEQQEIVKTIILW